MPIEYLKKTPEDAYKALDQVIVSGFELRERFINEGAGFPVGNLPPETVQEWRTAYRAWYDNVAGVLLDVYQSKRESLTFQHRSGLENYKPGWHAECSNLVTSIDTKLALLGEYIDFVKTQFNITFIADRDNNVQFGGSGNNQNIQNEG